MRKNSPRKWLHATLDLLPVILIPVFMIYSHRHTIDSYSITIEREVSADAFQYVKNGLPTQDISNWQTGGSNQGSISYLATKNGVRIAPSTIQSNATYNVFANLQSTYAYNNKYYLSFDVTSLDNTSFDVYFSSGLTTGYSVSSGVESTSIYSNYSFTFYQSGNDTNSVIDNVRFYAYGSSQYTRAITIKNLQVFNLTAIFGEGNEPTALDFKSYLVEDYYSFGNNTISLPTETITYNDTDIMSQMFYCLYNSVDKYFNMGNVFNLNGVYQWFSTNIFGGNVPPSVYIVWNIALYELVMDLLFLLYGLFMWFIDMVQHLMDKPFKSVK